MADAPQREETGQDEASVLKGGEGEEGGETSTAPLRIPKDVLARLAADLENLRKEIVAERGRAERAALEAMVRALAPALDSFAIALRELSPSAPEGIVKGLRKVYDQFVQAFAIFGIVPIPHAASYDPKFHEAVERVPGEAYAIIEEVSGGWMWQEGEQVIVPARVKVGDGTHQTSS
jgi:molecular chaperone GrpE (heat shock protein)